MDLEKMDHLALLDQKATQDTKVHPAWLACLEKEVFLEEKERKADGEILDPLDHRVLLENKGKEVFKALVAQLDLLEKQEILETKDPQVCLESRGQQE